MHGTLLARGGLTLDRLLAFLALVNAGGIAAAAKGDPVHQSQLSRQLKELEGHFGVTLVERRRGVFRVTSAGRDLLDAVRTIVTRLEDLERGIARQPMQVHIGAGESAMVWWLIRRLEAVFKAKPELEICLHNLQSEAIATGVRDGHLDFGIMRRAHKQSWMQSVALRPLDYLLFVPARGVSDSQRLDSQGVLAAMPLALLEGSSELNQSLLGWAQAKGVRLRIALRCTSFLQAAEAVRTLGMAAVLPTWATSAFQKTEIAVLALPPIRTPSTPMQLIWSKRQEATRPFLSQLGKVFGTALTSDRK